MAHEHKTQTQEVNLVRILGKDIRGDKDILVGLTSIQGISWAFANAVGKLLSLNKSQKIQEMSSEEIKTLETFLKNPQLPSFLKNRQKDFETGEDSHVIGADISLRKEFDIKRLKKIKSYKGIRHSNNLPVRGQRTKANFRRNRKKSGATGSKKK